MNIFRILGFVLLVVGVVCLGFAWNSSHAVIDKFSEAASGRYTQATMWYIISGVVMLITGGALWVGGRPKP